MKIQLSKQKVRVGKIAEKHGLKLVVIFGSFANGKNHKNSDLDIAILGEKRFSFDENIELINEFSKVFKREVDLSILNDANPLLLFEVSKNSVLLFGKKNEFFRFKLYAFKIYNDYTPYFEMEKKLNKKLIDAYVY